MLSPVTGEAWEQVWKVAGGIVSTDGKSDERWRSAHFPLPSQPWTPACEMELSILRLSLSTLVNLIQIILHRCAQRFISSAVLDPAKLAALPSHLSSGPVMDGLHHFECCGEGPTQSA